MTDDTTSHYRTSVRAQLSGLQKHKKQTENVIYLPCRFRAGFQTTIFVFAPPWSVIHRHTHNTYNGVAITAMSQCFIDSAKLSAWSCESALRQAKSAHDETRPRASAAPLFSASSAGGGGGGYGGANGPARGSVDN